MDKNSLDPRSYAYRRDLAADYLQGRVQADRFVPGTLQLVHQASLPMKATPEPAAAYSSELLYGERFMVYERRADGWAWGQSQTDGYVGYVAADGLLPAENSPPDTHEVAVLRTLCHPGPDLKLPPMAGLSLTSRVHVAEAQAGWLRCCEEGRAAAPTPSPTSFWLFARHLAPIGTPAQDPVVEARRFIGAPYLWGGRSSLGLDCSALVQLALARCGVAVPRDTDQQAETIGEAVDRARYGDLLYSPGHVVFHSGPGRDGRDRVLHANATHMAVVEEPFDDFHSRLVADGDAITRIRRPVLRRS